MAMKTHNLTLLILCIELYACTLYAHEAGGNTPRLKARVLFPLAGGEVDTRLQANEWCIRNFVDEWRRLEADSTCVIDSVVFYGNVSPEGTQEMNDLLARRRAQVFFDYLSRNKNFSFENIRISGRSCDWNELRRMVRRSLMEGRDEVLAILDAGGGAEWSIYSLMTCGKGKRWEYMSRYLFPLLRRATVEVYCHDKEKTGAPKEIKRSDFGNTQPLEPQRELDMFVEEPQQDFRRTSRFALKTNLLYMGAAVLNVEGEYFFNSHWSGCLEYQYAWWHKRPAFFYRLAAGGPEVRYWFPKKDKDFFHGHFVGAYVGGGLYEFMFKRSFGLQGEFYIAGGLSYGYTLPMGKRLKMEFSLGIGYLMTHYRQYYYDAGCYVYQQTKRYNYVGPTKAKISLVFPLFGGKRKGLPGQ